MANNATPSSHEAVALVAGGPTPPGFEPKRIELLARGLACKRRREALTCWPQVSARLGQDSALQLFSQYAHQQPRPRGGSPRQDGLQFILWLARRQPGWWLWLLLQKLHLAPRRS